MMTFGEAIEELKKGNHVTRKGWNGKNMFLFLQRGCTVIVGELRRSQCKSAAEASGKTSVSDQLINSHIDMMTADGTIAIGWLASQADMLSEDWMILR